MSTGESRDGKADLLQGILDLIILQTLRTIGPQHGFGLAKRIGQIAEGALNLNQGTIYPALLRLEQRASIRSKWGVSDNNRKAKFYELTRLDQRQIDAERAKWEQMVSLMELFLREVD